MKRVCTLGSATQDIFILYEGAETLDLQLKKSARSFLLFEQGTKVDVKKMHYATGGGATNAAVAFKRMGFDVEAFFKTGDDIPGNFIREAMIKEHVSINYCPKDPSVDTALSFIIPSREKNHVALCYRAANKHQDIKDFPRALLPTLDYLYISALSGTSETLFSLTEEAHKISLPVAANPGIWQLTHDNFYECLQFLDVLIVNFYEAEFLMKRFAENAQLQKGSSSSSSNTFLSVSFGFNDDWTLHDFFVSALNSGPRIVVLTHGAQGVYIAHERTAYFHPSLHAKVVSALGAGDAFGSAFISALILEKPIEEAILFGVLNAKSVIEHHDAKEGLLKKAPLEALVKELGTQHIKKIAL